VVFYLKSYLKVRSIFYLYSIILICFYYFKKNINQNRFLSEKLSYNLSMYKNKFIINYLGHNYNDPNQIKLRTLSFDQIVLASIFQYFVFINKHLVQLF